jgi:hypothetical protein
LARLQDGSQVAVKVQYMDIEANTQKDLQTMGTSNDKEPLNRLIMVGRNLMQIGIPFKSAQDYIDKLSGAEVFHEMSGYARNRIFQADEIFSAVQSALSHPGFLTDGSESALYL